MKNRRLQEILKEFPDDYDIEPSVLNGALVAIATVETLGHERLDIVDIKEDTNKVILFVDRASPVSA